MNTPFGKLIEKDFFGKLFFGFILVSILFGALMNGHAVRLLSDHIWLSCVIGALYIIMGLSTLMQKKITEKWRSKKLETTIGFSSCFFIYDFMILLLWKILAVIFSVPERAEAIGVFCSDILAAATVTMGYMHAKTIKHTSYSINIGIKKADYQIVLISDIHLGAFVGEKHIQLIVDQINKLKADLVVICGDMIDSNNHILADSDALAKISAIFQKIYAKEGVFAVLGNHDPKANHETFRKFLYASNIQLLHNQVVQLSKINLVGRTNAYNNDRCPIQDFWGKLDTSKPTVVLDHDPCYISEAVEFGADLVLSGHTHQGQFFPVTYFTKLANGKHYFYGHEMFGKTHAIISSGAGFFQLPVRIGTSNEIVDIHLT